MSPAKAKSGGAERHGTPRKANETPRKGKPRGVGPEEALQGRLGLPPGVEPFFASCACFATVCGFGPAITSVAKNMALKQALECDNMRHRI